MEEDIWETIKPFQDENKSVKLQKCINKIQWRVLVSDIGGFTEYIRNSFCGAAKEFLTLTKQKDDSNY